MKKIISILLAVMLVVSVAVVSAGAYNNDGDYSKINSGSTYNPSGSYTVDANTPYCEEAVQKTTGSLSNTQTFYFQADEDWANQFNTFPGPDLPNNEPYMHACAYWPSGNGSDWTAVGGGTVAWVGFQAHLVDKDSRIYSVTMPNDGGSPMVVLNNGINGGMDTTQEIYNYARQYADLNTEGAYEGDLDTLPEGSPTQDDFDGCIAIKNPDEMSENPVSHILSYGVNWYVYYGDGCYGEYAPGSANFVSKHENCLNPEHLADPDKYHPTQGDVNYDKTVDILDVLYIQRYLAGFKFAEGEFNEKNADVDGDGYISIIDATRIQRYLAEICNIDGTKPYTG